MTNAAAAVPDFARIDQPVFTRHAGNPVLAAADFEAQLGIKMRAVYNCAAMRSEHPSAQAPYVMLCRVNELNHRTLLWGADSDDGLAWRLRPQPFAMPTADHWHHYASSVYYDPRVTWIDGRYVVLLAVSGPGSSRVARFESADLQNLDFVDYICAPDNRNMVVFPEKIDDRYVRLERPNIGSVGGKGDVWLAHSPDLKHWGDWHRIIASSDLWNYAFSGLGPSTVPLRIDEGWLIFFHAIMNNCTTCEYAVGAAILDADRPWQVKQLTKHPVLYPEADYEMIGLVENVCFPCSAILESDSQIKLYYGAADTVQAVATAPLDRIVHACKHW